eukprot:CAMPEP_0183829082 /NCGR_PEP_ID=MMETSP0807_2-20130328/3124_1 /TAXON_ID=88271 /ORGANISM="Picocystis salinarum, Strain CCMP1897" /LENGTH=513 /DNA_ID=CAMNT_0026074289 /DNA_START=91 /DNA_END=1632 /DNA_ORIENTATION=+
MATKTVRGMRMVGRKREKRTNQRTRNVLARTHPQAHVEEGRTATFPKPGPFQRQEDGFEVTVVGAGPAGLGVAARLAGFGAKVAVVAPALQKPWPNNYGVWIDEFRAMGLEDCVDHVWEEAVVQLNTGSEHTRQLKRPYGRVDRKKLKTKLMRECIDNGVQFLEEKVNGVEHRQGTSYLDIEGHGELPSSIVVDATGHFRKLVEFDAEFNPGYQGAYGILVEVESHPFDINKMLFMDWRDDYAVDKNIKQRCQDLPTFLYAMPFSETYIFLEETSLVARPAAPFDDLKERLEARMKHLGIKVKHIEEEEYCLIPMGGVLPKFPQRVIGVGGTAGMVHPSTGYMISRVLGAVPSISDAIMDQLTLFGKQKSGNGNGSIPSEGLMRACSEVQAEVACGQIWHVVWPSERLYQREFFCFGMDVLLRLDLQQTREFFDAFFGLSAYNWQGFLSARLSFGELFIFGLALFGNASTEARISLLVQGIPGLLQLLLNVAKGYPQPEDLLEKDETQGLLKV